MEEHLSKANTAAKAQKNQSQTNNDNVEKSEISSLIYRGNSEFGTTFGDSAYSSLGHSAYSSIRPSNTYNAGLSNHLHAQYQVRNQNPSRKSSSNPSSKSSGLSGYKAQPTLVAQKNYSKALTTNKKERCSAQPLQKEQYKNSTEQIEQIPQEPQEPSFPCSQDTKAAKVASLSKALSYIDQLRNYKKKKSGKELASNQVQVSQTQKKASPSSEGINQSQEDQEDVPANIVQASEKEEGDGFCVAVSLQDGLVIHTTSTLSSVLGYPKDMWIGRSFIDFVHPTDREVFIAEVAKNVSLPANNINQSGKPTPGKNTSSKSDNFFCRIRRYNGLSSGFAVKERKTKYNSFKLCVCFSEVNTDTSDDDSESVPGLSIYLFITAIPLQSAYSIPNQEGPIQTKCGQEMFTSKHTSSCILTFLDENSISFLGYFPQDLLGTEIFEHIHPNDLPILKESCEQIMFGKHFKSQPYRMKTRNGDFVNVITVWSCFINPWSRFIEFIHGKHTVMKGPENPNVFMDPSSDSTRKRIDLVKTPKENIILKAEIKMILQKTARNNLSETIGSNAIKSTSELSSFMGTLLQEVAKAKILRLAKLLLQAKLS